VNSDRHTRLDEAIVAYRDNPTAANKDAVDEAAKAHTLRDMNEATVEYQKRTRDTWFKWDHHRPPYDDVEGGHR